MFYLEQSIRNSLHVISQLNKRGCVVACVSIIFFRSFQIVSLSISSVSCMQSSM
jgi:hypothetical protein